MSLGLRLRPPETGSARVFKGYAAEPSPAALADDQMRSADTALEGRRRRVVMVAIANMGAAYIARCHMASSIETLVAVHSFVVQAEPSGASSIRLRSRCRIMSLSEPLAW